MIAVCERFATALVVALLAAAFAAVPSAANGIEVGDRVAVVAVTTLTGDAGKSETLVPGTLLRVEKINGGQLSVTHAISGSIDAAAVRPLAEAAALLRDELKRRPEDAALHRALGHVSAALDEIDVAVLEFCQALRLSPDDALAHRWRAWTMLDVQLPRQALMDACAAVRLSKNDPLSLLARAELHRRLRTHDKALADADAAIQQNPTLAVAYVVRGDVRADQGNFDAAIAEYTKALEVDSDNVAALAGRAAAYLAKGLPDDAARDLTAAVEADPKYAPAYECLAQLCLDKRFEKYADAARAVKYARRACELSNWQCAAYIATLSKAYYAAGQRSKGVEARITALRVAMAEESRIANWKLKSHFDHCRHCRQQGDEPDLSGPAAPDNGKPQPAPAE